MAFGRKKTQKDDDPLAQFRKRPEPKAEKSDHKTVLAHEEEAARLFGGRRHRGSGANEFLKSDASSDVYQIEAKQTAGQAIEVSLDWVKKIAAQAAGRGKVPAIHLRFLREMPGVPTDWVAVPAAEFERLLKE